MPAIKKAEPYKVGAKVRFMSRHGDSLSMKVGTVSRDEDEDGMIKVDVLLTTYVHRSSLEDVQSWEDERNRV